MNRAPFSITIGRMRRWILFLTLLLAACSSARPTTIGGLPPPAQSSPLPFQPLPTSTHTATPTITPLPTVTLAPTPTATLTPLPLVRFAVIGDYGLADDAEAAVAALVLSWQPDFILTVGDNNYPSGAADTIDENVGQYFQAYIYPYYGQYGPGTDTNRFFPTLGNHDWTIRQAQAYFDYFTLPGNERYYDFTWGPVHIFALDSDDREPDGVGRSSDQAAWLQENLVASSATWNIIAFHHAPYSSALHGGTDWMRWHFKDWGADVVLSGHDHVYERLMIQDMPYFVNGLGGGARYAFNDPEPGSVVRYRNDYGAMLISASEIQITLEFITVDNEIIDSYTLSAFP